MFDFGILDMNWIDTALTCMYGALMLSCTRGCVSFVYFMRGYCKFVFTYIISLVFIPEIPGRKPRGLLVMT